MNHLVIIEVVISLALVYFVISTAISGVLEALNKWLKRRGKFLQNAIEKTLNDPQNKNWGDLLYNHPIVDGLKKDYKSLPSYISSDLFSTGIIDVIVNESKKTEVKSDKPGEVEIVEKLPHDNTFDNFKEGLKSLNQSDFKVLMNSLANESSNIIDLKETIAKWFDDYMDRASGWFKSKMKTYTLYLSILVTLFFNIDSISIIKTIWYDDQTRLELVNQAAVTIWEENSLRNSEATNNSLQYEDTTKIDSLSIQAHLKELNRTLDTIPSFLGYYELPFGWKSKAGFGNSNMKNIEYAGDILRSLSLIQLLGWLVTILALSLGAPFWFNLMNTFVNMRNAGKKPGAANEKK